MSLLGIYIVIGDLLVSGRVICLAIWLFAFQKNDESLAAAARIPLEEPEGTDD